MLALGEYSQLKDEYEQQVQLNQAAEQFAHQVCYL